MTLARVLRIGWMDLLSAASFLLIWLLRDRFDHATAMSLLFWPVVFEGMVTFGIAFAHFFNPIRNDLLRNALFVSVLAAILAAAWLTGMRVDAPYLWTIALWLLVARLRPPPGAPFAQVAHRDWVLHNGKVSAILWGAAFLTFIALMFLFPIALPPDPDGTARSTAPGWIFPLAWTPYFIAEACLRTLRTQPTDAQRH